MLDIIYKPALGWLAVAVAAFCLTGSVQAAMPGAELAARSPSLDRTAVAADTIAQRMQACAGCHGKEGRASADGYYPRIAGKPAGYLYNQLVAFREGHRTYPIMTYMVGYMSDDYMREIAEYFSQQNPPFPPPAKIHAAPEVLKRGETLVRAGDAALGVPACAACHGARLTGVNPATPGLVGLPQSYLSAQLGAFKHDLRRATQPNCMAEVARKLSADDINAVSSWLASQPVPAGQDALPAAPTSAPLPLQCGSVAH